MVAAQLRIVARSGVLGFIIASSVITLFIALKVFLDGPRARKAPPATPVPDDLRARLGDGLATFLVETRALRSALVLLEEETRVMLEGERHEKALGRPYPRSLRPQIPDVNYLTKVRAMRKQAAAWLDRLRAVDFMRERAGSGLDLEALPWSRWFEFPWGITPEHDRKPDRSDELDRVLEDTLAIAGVLARIDAELSAAPMPAYR